MYRILSMGLLFAYIFLGDVDVSRTENDTQSYNPYNFSFIIAILIFSENEFMPLSASGHCGEQACVSNIASTVKQIFFFIRSRVGIGLRGQEKVMSI